jgi:LPXTG-site transpeptidase (sortase) family protein
MPSGKRKRTSKADTFAKAPKANKAVVRGRPFQVAGLVLAVLSGLYLLLAFFPVLTNELWYLFNSHSEGEKTVSSPVDGSLGSKIVPLTGEIVPADPSFSIVIPKIGANSRVIANVDPYNSREYQMALTKGVAHAKGTSLPGQDGNVFLFAHSSDNWFNANRYNSVFYLLHHLETGDDIYVIYLGKKYTYEVTEKSIVSPSEVKYMDQPVGEQKLTLMTCWPAGTTISRLVIVARRSDL